jgi:ATP-dependent DNA helicase PIF1
MTQNLKSIIGKIEKGHNLFITGGAGSGKSYMLRELKHHFLKDISLTASTGIAALNIGGLTIHSFAKLGIGRDSLETILNKLAKDKKSLNRLLSCKILAIDEISMLSAKFLNLLNSILKIVRQSNAPFGGVTMLCFGDFLQLPPIIKEPEEDGLSLNCSSWKEGEFETILLKENHRQKGDSEFYEILQSIRIGKNIDSAYKKLQERVGKVPIANAIKLVSHKDQAKKINLENLEKLPFQTKTYKAKHEGKEEYVRSFLPHFEETENLTLKKGARVMLNWNLKVEDGLCNGSIGNIVDFSPKNGFPVVLFEGVKFPVTIMPNDFTIQDPTNEEVLFSFTQIPLQLAYSLTIHKSQGLTFENVSTDISKCFTTGQAYVSLSRAKSLEGLFLEPFGKYAIKTDKEIALYYENLAK